MNQLSKKQRLEMVRTQLENERSSFIPHYRDLVDFIRPRRGRFFAGDVNKGDRRSQNIINSRATLSSRVLSSGMMTGITSPARPWFHLTTPDPDLADFQSVKQWLHQVDQRMGAVFRKSNFYNSMPTVYGDSADFATAAMLMEFDKNDIIRTRVYPVGSYAIAVDYRGKVNTFVRTFSMTVQQLIEEFGRPDEKDHGKVDWSNFSATVKTAYEQSNYSQWVEVVHVIMPNPDYNPRRIGAKYKKFTSSYYEKGKGSEFDSQQDIYLRESGYDYFPVLCPRWEVAGEDSYGTNCPGMTALGDIRGLQKMESKSLKAVDKMVDPPMIGPTAMEGVRTSILPSDITYFDEREGVKGFRPAHELNFRVDLLQLKMDQVEARIKEAYFHDIMLMFSESDRREITAKEIEERGNEKFLVLGTVLEQLNMDLLDPAIEITFAHMLQAGLIPPAPPELEGIDLKVEYVSVMAQAQKLISLDGVNKFLTTIGRVAEFDPNILYKVNTFELANVIGDITSVPPKILNGDDEAKAARDQVQKAAMQQQQMETMQAATASAKNLAQAPVSPENALGKVLGQ